MLYVTTRNNLDSFTAQHALKELRSPDDGLLMPIHVPKLTESDLMKLSEMSGNQRIAEILNMFFGTKITGWDVDFSIGRYPIRIEPLSHRIFLTETWHNPQWKYSYLEDKIAELLQGDINDTGSWLSVAIRMAVLAAVLLEQEDFGDGTVDIAGAAGDFTTPVSAWILREMGFPVGNIVCCCNENNRFWDLICNGQMKTDDMTISTIIPEADVSVPVNLERLVFICADWSETKRYLDCCGDRRTFTATDALLEKLRKGLYVSVVSSDRIEYAIPNVYKTYEQLLTPASALAYSGLMDYRSKTGTTRTAMILCDKSPSEDLEAIARCMKLSEAELLKLI